MGWVLLLFSLNFNTIAHGGLYEMKQLSYLLVLGVICFAFQVNAGEPVVDGKMWSVEEYLILFSSRDYQAARKFAEEIARKVELPLDLQGVKYHKRLGLTYGNEECHAAGYQPPCYYARTHEARQERAYVSLEYSSSYDFKKGYYIVLAAVGLPKSPFMQETLQRVKKHVPDAYIKRSKIYLGCHH